MSLVSLVYVGSLSLQALPMASVRMESVKLEGTVLIRPYIAVSMVAECTIEKYT